MTMSKKSIFVSIILSAVVVAVISGTLLSSNNSKPMTKASHAERLWKTSGHADSTAEAFVHWDEDGEIPTFCAKCHSTHGFLDFLGADGSTAGKVDSAAELGTTVECEVCHTDKDNGVVRNHASVKFPSGVIVEDLGPEALCMECHQGRESSVSVNKEINDAAVGDDTISADLGFLNIHYYAAASSQFGTVVKGGYEYADKMYDARFSHVTGYNACITCHNSHSLEVDLDPCLTCHSVNDPKDIRYYGSAMDYDGDGDISEGIYYEIQTYKPKLYTAIKRYAMDVLGEPIVYDSHSYPYFFNDLNANGMVDSNEANYGNRYQSFSPRLLRAAYNYQVSQKEPAGYAHGGKYFIQLLYDSIADLNTKLPNPVNMAGMYRTDEGHFDGSAEAWRHWDDDGEVSASCARCHSAEGLAYYVEHGENEAAHIANGMLCTTCHTSPPAIRKVSSVKFPSGEVLDIGDNSNICMVCHQGRSSRNTVNDATKKAGPYTFINIHYYPAAAVLFGSEAKGGFEFWGKTYAGKKTWPNHLGKFDTCVECHMGTMSSNIPPSGPMKSHNVQKPNPADCVDCHGGDIAQTHPGADPKMFEFEGIRPATVPDYDGDGNTAESTKAELQGLEAALYAQIQAYGIKIGFPIIYNSHAYPYFFNDSNGNGLIDPGEAIYPNRYKSFNAPLLRTAYNYQMSKKDPNGFIHNSRYVAQLLVDSIEHIGGDVSPYTWR